MRKLFSPSLHKANDSLAKQAGMWHLLSTGATWVSENPDKYGCDLIYRDGAGVERLLEVEIKKTWYNNSFPFETVNVLQRKEKYFKMGADLLLLSGGLKDYLILDGPTILTASLVEVENKFVLENERFYQVPKERAEFYKFSKPLKKRDMTCRCGSCSFLITEVRYMCDKCGRLL